MLLPEDITNARFDLVRGGGYATGDVDRFLDGLLAKLRAGGTTGGSQDQYHLDSQSATIRQLQQENAKLREENKKMRQFVLRVRREAEAGESGQTPPVPPSDEAPDDRSILERAFDYMSNIPGSRKDADPATSATDADEPDTHQDFGSALFDSPDLWVDDHRDEDRRFDDR